MKKQKIITGLLVVGVSASLLLTGCTDKQSEHSFQERLNVGIDFSLKTVTSRIITDPKTGIEYIELYRNDAGGVSITPRLDKNGKPYVNPEWKKK